MVRTAKLAGIKVLLLTPTPDLAAKLTDPNDPLSKQATQIRRIANEEEVALADPYAEFQKISALGKDLSPFMAQSNHPNRAGHEIVLASILEWFPIGKSRLP